MTRKTWLGMWAFGVLMTLGACANGEGTNEPFMRDPDVMSTGEGEFETCVSPVVGCPCKQGLCVEGLVCEAQMCREPIPPDTDPTLPPTATFTDTAASDTDMTVGDTDSSSLSDSDTDGDTDTDSSTDSDTDGSTTTSVDPSDTETTDGPPDPCANSGSGSGHYCGGSLGGIDNALYYCSQTGVTIEIIEAGECDCVVCPPGWADYCEGGYEPAASCAPEPPSCGDGMCGDDESCASCPEDCGEPACTDAFDDPVCAGDTGVRECPGNPDGVQPCTCNPNGSWSSCSPGCLL